MKTYEQGLIKGEQNLQEYKRMCNIKIKEAEKLSEENKRLRNMVSELQNGFFEYIKSLSVEYLQEIIYDKIREEK